LFSISIAWRKGLRHAGASVLNKVQSKTETATMKRPNLKAYSAKWFVFCYLENMSDNGDRWSEPALCGGESYASKEEFWNAGCLGAGDWAQDSAELFPSGSSVKGTKVLTAIANMRRNPVKAWINHFGNQNSK
jgi:hypothetical protein